MKVQYQYAGPSRYVVGTEGSTLGLCPDLSRDERVSFRGRVRDPLPFRDAMLMLRDIVITDSRPREKDRSAYFQWLEEEIRRRVLRHEAFQPHVRSGLLKELEQAEQALKTKDLEIGKLLAEQRSLRSAIRATNAWRDYDRLEHAFWRFLRERDRGLWYVLDPVITVHQDQVSFEAFSRDESVYACLSINMQAFDLLQRPALGTTNIDFSGTLAKEIQRFRPGNPVELSVAPEGFAVESGGGPTYMEKKIDLPESWIKGFTQVSAAAGIPGGVSFVLSPVDLYDICGLLRRRRAHESPRSMRFILKKGERVRVLFEPFGELLTLEAVYHGDSDREERIWGRRRWLVLEKLIPLAKKFTLRFLGFALPQFVIADLGEIKMTVGFSAWSQNDWVKGTAFSVMSGFLGEGNYPAVRELLRENRRMTAAELCHHLGDKKKTIAGIGSLYRRGEGYYDAVKGLVRYRQLTAEPLPEHLRKTTQTERRVQQLMDQGLKAMQVRYQEEIFYLRNRYEPMAAEDAAGQGGVAGYGTAQDAGGMDRGERPEGIGQAEGKKDKGRQTEKTEIQLNRDGEILKVSCSCRAFKKGAGNVSAPCAHVMALYLQGGSLTKLKLKPDQNYDMQRILEVVLS